MLTGKILKPTSQFRFRERSTVKDLRGANVPQIQTHLGFMVLQQWYENISMSPECLGEWVSVEIDFTLGKDEKDR